MTKKTEKRISAAEWEVIRVLWDVGRPMTATEVAIELEGRSDSKAKWQRRTVRTFLNRLVAKKAVAAKKQIVAGMDLLHFSPLVCETETLCAEQKSFLSRFFGGTIQSMLASCIQDGRLSTEEMKQLHEMLDKQIKQEAEQEEGGRHE